MIVVFIVVVVIVNVTSATVIKNMHMLISAHSQVWRRPLVERGVGGQRDEEAKVYACWSGSRSFQRVGAN